MVRLPGKGALPPLVQTPAAAVPAAAAAFAAFAASDCSAAAWPDLACATATTAATASGCKRPAAKDEGPPRGARAPRASLRWDHGDWNEDAVPRMSSAAEWPDLACAPATTAATAASDHLSGAGEWPDLTCAPAAAAPTASLRQRRLAAEIAVSSEALPPPSSTSAVARPSLPSPAVLSPAVLSPALTPATEARRDERESVTSLRAAPTIGGADDRAALRPRRPKLAQRDTEFAQRDAELAQRDAPAQRPTQKRAPVRSIKLSPEHPSIYYL